MSEIARPLESTSSEPWPGKTIPAGIIWSSALYRPLDFWAQHPWDIGFPIKLFVIGGSVFLLGGAIWHFMTTKGKDPLVSAVTVGAVTLVAYYWNQLAITPFLWLVLALFVPAYLISGLSGRARRWVTISILGMVGVFPILNLSLAHFENADSYPTIELSPRVTATARDAVEDIFIVVTDSYPAPVIARTWFDHVTEPLVGSLEANDFTVYDVAMSRHTFTGLAIPSMFELQPVVDAGRTSPWGNRESLYGIIRGDSFTHDALESAGYEYFHVDGGWNGSGCRFGVAHCLESPFVDETVWNLLGPSAAGSFLARRYGSYTVPGTLAAHQNVIELLESLQGNGRHDFVFAHFFLPHPPVLVDEECELADSSGEATVVAADSPFDVGYEQQLSCVDGLLVEIAERVAPNTAALITADHGTALGGHVFDPPGDWSNANIAERFSILLALHLPTGCDGPEEATNVDASRAVLSCALDIALPPRHTGYLIGSRDPDWVDPQRMEDILALMRAGTPPLPDSG